MELNMEINRSKQKTAPKMSKCQKRKKRTAKGKKNIGRRIVFSILTLVILSEVFYLVYRENPIYNDDNTASFSGVVTSVDNGRKVFSANHTTRYAVIQFDNGKEYENSYEMFRVCMTGSRHGKVGVETLKEKLLNKKATGRYSSAKPYKMVSLKTEEEVLLDYNVINQCRNRGMIGFIIAMVLACLLAFARIWISIFFTKG